MRKNWLVKLERQTIDQKKMNKKSRHNNGR